MLGTTRIYKSRDGTPGEIDPSKIKRLVASSLNDAIGAFINAALKTNLSILMGTRLIFPHSQRRKGIARVAKRGRKHKPHITRRQ